MRSGTCFQPHRQERRIVVSGSSYSRGEYPTPAAQAYGTSQNEGKKAHKRPTNGTPSLETWARTMWATPTAGDSKASGSRNAPGSKAHAGTSLTDMVKTGDSFGRRGRETTQDGETGSPPVVLNPQFVETLMGFPRGWTDCER